MKRTIPKHEESFLNIIDNFFKLHDTLYNYELTTHSYEWAHGSEYLLCFENSFTLDSNGNIDCCFALLKDGKATILRDVTFKLSPVLFLPTNNNIGIGIEGKDTISSVIKLFKLSNPLFLKFAKRNSYSSEITPFKIINPNIDDDLGTLFFDFEDIKVISKVNVPKTLIDRVYTLVGVNHQTPYAKTDDADCILFAQKFNEYDSYAIKVLRWFPPTRKAEYAPLFNRDVPSSIVPLHEGIRSYGYIARNENTALHDFMIANSRILFGKVKKSKIKIIGGIESFIDGELKDRYFPQCLIEFVQ